MRTSLVLCLAFTCFAWEALKAPPFVRNTPLPILAKAEQPASTRRLSQNSLLSYVTTTQPGPKARNGGWKHSPPRRGPPPGLKRRWQRRPSPCPEAEPKCPKPKWQRLGLTCPSARWRAQGAAVRGQLVQGAAPPPAPSPTRQAGSGAAAAAHAGAAPEAQQVGSRSSSRPEPALPRGEGGKGRKET